MASPNGQFHCQRPCCLHPEQPTCKASTESPSSDKHAVFDSQLADQSTDTSPLTANCGSPEFNTGGYLEPPSYIEHVAAVGLLQLAVSNVPQVVLKKQRFYDRKIYSPTLFSEEHGTVYITSVLADVLAIKKDTHHSLSFYSRNIDVLVSQNGFVWQLEAVDRATRSVDASTFWQDPDTKEQVMDRCALTLLADYSKTKGFTAAEWLELMARSGMRHEMVYYSKDLQRSYTLSDILGIEKATQEFHFSIQKDGITLAALKPSRRRRSNRSTRWAPY